MSNGFLIAIGGLLSSVGSVPVGSVVQLTDQQRADIQTLFPGEVPESVDIYRIMRVAKKGPKNRQS